MPSPPGFIDTSHPYVIMTFNWPTCTIPSSVHPKKQSKLQHFDVWLTLSSWQLTSFVIHHWLLFAMASIRFTVHPAKKKKFPQLHPSDAKTTCPGRHETGNVFWWGHCRSRIEALPPACPSRGHSESDEGAPWCIPSAPNHRHLVVTTDAKSGRSMNWLPRHWRRLPNRLMTSCPLKWINWLPRLPNQLLGVARQQWQRLPNRWWRNASKL